MKSPEKRSPITVGTERVPMSPAEKAAKIRRLGRLIQHGQPIKALQRRGYTEKEIEAAREMIGRTPRVRRVIGSAEGRQ